VPLTDGSSDRDGSAPAGNTRCEPNGTEKDVASQTSSRIRGNGRHPFQPNDRITPRRSESRSVGVVQFVAGDGRGNRSRHGLRNRGAEATLVERTLLNHGALHATTTAWAGRAGRSAIHRATATTRRRRVSARSTSGRITAAAATVEQATTATTGRDQESESDGEEREAFHRNDPFRKGSASLPVRTAGIAGLLTARTRSRDWPRVDFEKNQKFGRERLKKIDRLAERRANDRHFLPERQHELWCDERDPTERCRALSSSMLAPAQAPRKSGIRGNRSEIF